MMKKITPDMLVPMDDLAQDYPFRVELSYTHDDNVLFREAIYHKGARLWLHTDLADIIVKASLLCLERYDLKMLLYDGLRTTSAQAAMLKTKRVQDNLHWLEEPRLLSPPGGGAHPRGMAIDVSLETLSGELLDMGTVFDYLAEDSSPAHNPAHRDYEGHPPHVVENRQKLDEIMRDAAQALDLPLWPLPQEWWDFRFPPEIYELYAPLSDDDLPPEMRLLS